MASPSIQLDGEAMTRGVMMGSVVDAVVMRAVLSVGAPGSEPAIGFASPEPLEMYGPIAYFRE